MAIRMAGPPTSGRRDETVGATPGRDFGEAGEGWLRFCYAASEDKLRKALVRLGPVLGELGG